MLNMSSRSMCSQKGFKEIGFEHNIENLRGVFVKSFLSLDHVHKFLKVNLFNKVSLTLLMKATLVLILRAINSLMLRYSSKAIANTSLPVIQIDL